MITFLHFNHYIFYDFKSMVKNKERNVLVNKRPSSNQLKELQSRQCFHVCMCVVFFIKKTLYLMLLVVLFTYP